MGMIVTSINIPSVGKLPGALSILAALGFREEESGSAALPMTADLKELDARRLELEVGLDLLQKRIENEKKMEADNGEAAATDLLTPIDDAAKKATGIGIRKGRVLPPRPTNGATIAAELTIAASVSSKKNSDNTSKIPLDKKNDSFLQEEKSKRLKAETALVHQKSLILDLQSQISELQEIDQKNLTLRQGLTISRLEIGDKEDVRKEAQLLGVDSFAFHDDSAKKKSDVITKSASAAVATTMKDKARRSILPVESQLQKQPLVSLTHPVSIGDTRLHVTSHEAFKKGMYIIIGEGFSAECRKISGFGSILIDKPLDHSHPAGSTIRAFSATEKNILLINSILAEEYVRGLLLDEIIPEAVSLGNKNLLEKELNVLYKQRAMLKHTYTLVKQKVVPTGQNIDSSSSITVHALQGKIFSVSDCGALSSLDFAWSTVDMLNLFEDLAFRHVQATEGELMCERKELLRHIDSDARLRGVTHQLAESRGFASFVSMMDRAAQGAALLSYTVYISMLQPSASRAAPIISVTDKEILLSKYGVDSQCIDLLVKVFTLTDFDEDDSISPSEARASFAQLDGCFTDFIQFSKAMSRVVGPHTDEQRLSAVSYITVRAEYAALMRTLPGGLLLHGRRCASVLISSLEQEYHSPAPMMISVIDVIKGLSQSILDSTLLTSGQRVSTILAVLSSPCSRDLIISALTGRVLIGGCPRREERVLDNDSIDVAQISSSINGKCLYLLGRDGVIHIFDVETSRIKIKRRIIWTEPPPQRAVEGYETFLKWRKASGLDYNAQPGDSDSTMATMLSKARDTIDTSSLLATFVLSLPSADVSSRCLVAAIVVVDNETGLIAVNCAASSGAICIHEPISFRRIYRIKAPGSIGKDLSSALQGISVGEKFRGRQQPQMSEGLVNSMVLWSRRSLLLCTIGASHDLHIISLLTGDSIITLAGHTENISCLSISCSIGLIFTGSLDGNVRVWIADECIPHRLAAFGTFDDPKVHHLEKKVAQPMGHIAGTGMRQILRNLSSRLSSKVRLTPIWRRGKIASFFDGTRHRKEPHVEQHSVGVEVVFENGSVQIYSNRVLLRYPNEAIRAPKGPPLWSEAEVPLVIGHEVAIYEIDPDIAACLCARKMGQPVMASQSYAQCALLLNNLLDSKDDDTTNILEAIGLHTDRTISIFTLIRRVFKYPEKYSNRCDRLLTSHDAPVVNVNFSLVSKLLIAIDMNGVCCVWDPCAYSVILTISTPTGGPAFFGAYPYSLVHRSNLLLAMKGAGVADTDQPSFGGAVRKSSNLSVSSVGLLSVPRSMTSSFPINREVINKAFSIDSKFHSADVTVRGFIYVMRDLSTCCIETSCFRLALVTMDSPEQFMCLPRLSGGRGRNSLTKLQELYLRRGDVLRIVYAVTCSHANLDALNDDLRQYGVLQRGYTTTPSEQIEVICFERPKGWLELTKEYQVMNNTLNVTEKRVSVRSGIIIASTGNNEFRVALDFSNDFIHIKSSQIQMVFHTSDSSISRVEVSNGALSLGSRVQFSVEDAASVPHPMGALEENIVQDTLIISVRCVDSDGALSSSILPLLIGRSSFPLPALEMDLPPCQDTATVLSHSLLDIALTSMGRLSAHMYNIRSMKAAWIGTYCVHQMRVWDAISILNDKPKAVLCMDVVKAFSGLDMSAAAFAADLFLSLSSLRVSPSHPLMVCLDSMLGGQGGALFKDAEDFQHGKSGNSLEILQSLLCMRLGLLPEEICREVQNMGTRDVESILVSLYLALCNGPSMNILHEKIGPLNATILSTAFSCKIDESGVGAGNNFLSAKADENRTLMARLRDRKGAGVLTVHLLQHWLTRCLVGHTAALSVMNKRAVSGLLTDVSAISLPLLMAVKDSPLLPPPTYEQIRRNFPSRVRSAPRGHYTVVTKKPFPPDASPLFHGLKMQIVKSIKPHSSSSNGSTDDGDAVCSFLSWTYNYKKDREHDEDPSLIAAMAQLMQLAAPLQEDSLIIVPSASGVGFVGETGGALSGVIHEWDDTWQPLSVLVAKHKGSFCQGRVDLLRLQATRLLDAIIELHDSGVIIRGLSPSTVILDSTGTKVRLLLLPIAYDMDKTLDRGDSAETIVNEGALTAYIASSQGDDLRLCCIPHQGLDASSAVDLTGSNWDTWSFGSVLFIMAFGHSPLASKSLLISQSKKEDHIYGSLEQKDSSSSAAAILLSLMIPKFDTGMRSRRSSTKYSTSLSLPEDLRGIETEGGEQLLIAEFLQYALENQSRELIFSLLSDITGHSMTNLSAFRVAFCHQAPICGLTDRAASLLWEKMIQILFSRLSLGTSSLLSMRLKLAKLPHDLNLSSAMAFSDEHFGLIVTNQEFEALVNSLSDNLSQKQRSFPECAKKMFKSISGMLEEIQWYGLFQQVLYVTSTCLSVDPHERPPLKDLRRLALFDLSENEIALAKACREAKILMAPYTNTENFFSIMLLEPFSRDLLTLMSQTTSIDHTLIDSAENEELVACMHSNLEKLTSLMGCIEELGSLAVTKANGKCQSKPKADISLGYFLSSLCVDCQWLSERVVQILALVVESNMISGIALYVLRFISTDAAQRSSDIRLIGGIGRENEKERDTRGLSIGSRLIMRMAKFLEHLSICLCGLSRDLLLSAVLVEELKRMEHEDADVNTFQSVIDLRKVADGLYSSCLCGVIMLYTGEEAPLTAVGPYGTNLREAHHQLLKSYEIPIFTNASPTGKIPIIDPLDIPMECRWNAHTCKLFEPILLELVGEDGRGSHRMSIGGEMLSQADKFVDELHTKVVLPSLSAVNVSRRNIMEGSAIGQGVESRGSVFFVNLLRVCRALCGEESSGTGRAKERANLNVVTAMALCLPASAPHTAIVTEGAKAAQRRSGPTAKIPDNDTWQRLHVLLDTRSAIRMYSYFSSPEPAMKSSLLKICCRALGICLHVPADIGLTDPYMSTGLEFTSECWIYNISEILKVKVENADLALSALECLRNMAQRREWMRCWAMFDILPILCFLSRSAGKNVALIRTEAMEVLRLSTLHRPEGTRAMINLRMPHACEIPGAAGPESLSILSAEAADMSFGSTLGEQAKFTDALLDWVSISFPSDVPIQKEDYRNSDIPWIPLFDLATMVSSWIPKLCLTLQISDTESAVKKEKEALSVTVACKQISTVQKILLHACISGHPEALSATISCIWAPSRDPEMSLALGNIEGSGLLSCLDQLTTAGIYVDTFLSLKLQIQIVRSLCQLMIYGNRDLIHSFLDCSIVHSFSLFFQCVVDTVTNVTRLNQMTAFSSEYSSIFSAVSFVWETLLSLALIDDRVEEEIIDSGILQKLAEEWLPCSQCVTLILSADVPYNPFIVRSIALRMIRGILLPKGIERVTQRVGQGTEAGDRHSPSDRLAVETTRWLVSTRAVQRELMTIRSTVSTPITSTAAKKLKNASANISLTARRTAADVLITLAGARLEKIDQELQVTKESCSEAVMILLIFCRS